MNRNYSIDILKFVLAYEVVMLHCSQEPAAVFRPIVDSAVPGFFMISGYLIYSDDNEKYNAKLKRAIKRTAFLLLWSTLLCGVDDFCRLIFFDDKSSFTFEALCNFVFFNENPFAFHLWYISAYLYTLIVYLFMSYGRISIRVTAIIGMWLIGVMLVFYSVLFSQRDVSLLYIRNFLFQGIPFFGLGIILRKHKDSFSRVHIWHIIFLLIFFIQLAIFERSIEKYSIGTYIFSGMIAFMTLLVFIKIRITKTCLIATLGKEEGLYIYIFHPLTMKLFRFSFVIDTIGYNGYFFSSIVFVVTILAIRSGRHVVQNLIYANCLRR